MGGPNTPYDAAAICHAVSQIQLSVRDFVPTDVREAVAMLDDIFETLWQLEHNLNQRPVASKATKNMILSCRNARSQSISDKPMGPDTRNNGLASTDIQQVVDEFFTSASTFPTARHKSYSNSSGITDIARKLNLEIYPAVRDTLEYLSTHIDRALPTRKFSQTSPLTSISQYFDSIAATPPSIQVNQPAISTGPAMKPQSFPDSLKDPHRLEEEDDDDDEEEEDDDEEDDDEELSDSGTEQQQGSYKELDSIAPRHNMQSSGDFEGSADLVGSGFAQTLSSLTKDPPPPRKMKGVGDCEKIIAYAQRHPEDPRAQEQSQIAEKRISTIHDRRSRRRRKEKEARREICKYPVQFRGKLRAALKNDRKNKRSLK